MKTIWKVFAWISIICGLFAYLLGWIALFSNSILWNIPNEFWFYDAIATGIFALFFIIYGAHSVKSR